MPSNTPNFNLPYPNGSDDPCLFAQQWCDFTESINGVLALFQAGINRANPVVPAAMLRISTPRNIINLNLINFDEVVFDTAGMTDLDADPYRIYIRRPGRYIFNGFVDKDTSGVVDSQFSITAQHELPAPGGQLDATSVILDRGANDYLNTAYSPSQPLVAGDRVSMFYNTGTATAQEVNTAWMSVIWVADTEVP